MVVCENNGKISQQFHFLVRPVNSKVYTKTTFFFFLSKNKNTFFIIFKHVYHANKEKEKNRRRKISVRGFLNVGYTEPLMIFL